MRRTIIVIMMFYAMLNCIANVSVTQSMYLPSQNVVAEFMAVEPHGGLFGESASRQNYKYSGKELERMNGLNTYDFHARSYYYSALQFHSPDLLSEKTPWLSPYLYCANNPLIYIDPTGNAWFPKFDQYNCVSGYEWVAEDKSYDANGNLNPGLYSQAIFFSDNGTFDDKSKYNMGSSTATVYKADGTTEDFSACTYPSDIEAYVTVPGGLYEAKLGSHRGKYPALRLSDVGTSDFNLNSIELGIPNPSNKSKTTANGINIHKPGLSNLTGKTKDGSAISEGCLLIDRNKWNNFISIFNTPIQSKNIISVYVSRNVKF